MAQYEYRCPECSPWTAALPIGTAEAAQTCPACGGWSRRRWNPPSVNLMDQGLVRHRLREEASRDAPEVASAIPRAARRRPSPDPRHAALPLP
jgi:putative FmdB family regulatory protein